MNKGLEIREEKIRLEIDGIIRQVPAGISCLELIKDLKGNLPSPVVGAKYNNELVDLSTKITAPGKVALLDLQTEDGLRIYRQSLVFLLTKAANELYPGMKIAVKHSLGKSYYCEFKENGSVSPLKVRALEAKMRELVAADEAIIPKMMSFKEARECLESFDREDTMELLEFLRGEKVKIYSCGNYVSYSAVTLVPRTGLLGIFQLEPYQKGFLLRFPSAKRPTEVASRPNLPKLSQVWQESEEWAGILGVRNLSGFLSVFKCPKEANTLIHVAEALHEKKISQIADEIFAKREKIRLVLVAGPSSSGKTTFAQRLAIQLRVLGLRPISISTDDYFVDREQTPRDDKGDYDFEALEAVDIPLFNEQLKSLIECEEVVCPTYNFHLGAREWPDRKVRVDRDHPIIIEGIHALNEKLTESIARENKYKIYISALTQISIDDHNRIHTTDMRLIRRIVRDNQYRSQDALNTLQRWASVRRGEEMNIFPFQEDADIMFNSALVYEVGVLKPYAYALLKSIDREQTEFSDAQRLLQLLDFFPEIPEKNVPLNSILREFIGGSSIHGN